MKVRRESFKIKIVYVGDNRNRGNFGCRATSTALSQLIEKNHTIVGVVSGKYTNIDTGNLFFYKYFPKSIYKFLGKLKKWEYVKQGFYLFAKMIKKNKYLFSNFDFVSYDLDKSIDNLIKCLPANICLKEMDLRNYDFDALVVNGEGSFIFATPPWRECLVEAMLMHWALKMNKKVYYLNGMFSDDPYSESNKRTLKIVNDVLCKCQVVQVREGYSLNYARKNFSTSRMVFLPDALFTWYDYVNDAHKIEHGKYIIGPSGATNSSFSNIFDFKESYICVAGSSSIMSILAGNTKHAIEVYSSLVNALKEKIKMNIFLVEVCEGDRFLREVSHITKTPLIPMDTPILSAAKILANAKVFVSGRYHPAILASLGGTPCVFMSSNSHKTRSIQELLKYDEIKEYSVLPTMEEINRIVNHTMKLLDGGECLRDRIKLRAYELSKEAEKIADLVTEN